MVKIEAVRPARSLPSVVRTETTTLFHHRQIFAGSLSRSLHLQSCSTKGLCSKQASRAATRRHPWKGRWDHGRT